VLIDETLLRFDNIWAAAGTPNAVFRLTPADLVALTRGLVVDAANSRSGLKPQHDASRCCCSGGGLLRGARIERCAAWGRADDAFRRWSYVHSLPRIPSHSLRGLVLSHRKHGAGERAVGLSQLIQNREVIGVGDGY